MRLFFLLACFATAVDGLGFFKMLTTWRSAELLGRFCVSKELGKESAALRVKLDLTYPLVAQGVRVILHQGNTETYRKAFVEGTCYDMHQAANVKLGTGRTINTPIFDGSAVKSNFVNGADNEVTNYTQSWSIDGVQPSGVVSVRDAYPGSVPKNSTLWATSYEVKLESTGYSTLQISDSTRFIYAVLVNCDPDVCALNRPCYGALQGVRVDAELRSDAGPLLDHFSCDQSLVFVASSIFLYATFFVSVLMLVFVVGLQMRGKLHWTAILPFGALLAQFAGLALSGLHYTVYGVDGRGAPSLEYIGRFCYAVANSLTLTLLMLLALGYTTVRKDLKTRQWIVLIIFLIVYAFAELGCLIWYVIANSESGADAVYLYDTAAGYVVCALRGFAAIVLCSGVCSTMRWSRFRQKRKFHAKLFIGGLAWVLWLPIAVLIALALPVTVRTDVMVWLELAVAFLSQIVRRLCCAGAAARDCSAPGGLVAPHAHSPSSSPPSPDAPHAARADPNAHVQSVVHENMGLVLPRLPVSRPRGGDGPRRDAGVPRAAEEEEGG
jgi:hypothetical protein